MDPPQWGDFTGDASLSAVPYLHQFPHVRRILVVRHPLEYAGSLLRVGPLKARSQVHGLQTYLDQHYPEIYEEPDELSAALRFWLIWNTLADNYANIRVRLDDLGIYRLFELVGHEPKWPLYDLGPVNVGPLPGAVPRLADVKDDLAREVRNLALYFGWAL